MENIRTDLAIEAHEMCQSEDAAELRGVTLEKFEEEGVSVTSICVETKEGEEKIGKPIGRYVTIEAPGIKYSDEIYERTCTLLASEIKKMCEISEDTKILVVGLGNKLITPDALGPEVVSRLMVTNHMKTQLAELLDEGCSAVCALTPGVLGTTGIETSEIIKGVSDKIRPDIVICVDALAARSIDRISTTVQLSDTGISPGSGVENKRQGINEETIGAKVIAVGVPTVVDAATIASDSIDIALGTQEANRYGMIKKALSESTGNMMVTPKDIDLVIARAAKTVANGINLALHKNLTFSDIESFVG